MGRRHPRKAIEVWISRSILSRCTAHRAQRITASRRTPASVRSKAAPIQLPVSARRRIALPASYPARLPAVQIGRVQAHQAGHALVVVQRVAARAEPLHRLGQCKLYARQPLHEVPPAHLPAELHPLQLHVQRTPVERGLGRLRDGGAFLPAPQPGPRTLAPRDQLGREHAIARKQQRCQRCGTVFDAARRPEYRGPAHKRPAPAPPFVLARLIRGQPRLHATLRRVQALARGPRHPPPAAARSPCSQLCGQPAGQPVVGLPLARRTRLAQHRGQRREAVARHQPGQREPREPAAQRGRRQPEPCRKVRYEGRTLRLEVAVDRGRGTVGRVRQPRIGQRDGEVAQEQPAFPAADESYVGALRGATSTLRGAASTDPRTLPAAQQRVQRRLVVADRARGQHVALPHGHGQGQPAQLPDRSGSRVRLRALRRPSPLPAQQECGEHLQRDRRNLPPQERQRATIQPLEQASVAVLVSSRAIGRKPAAHQLARCNEPVQLRGEPVLPKPVPVEDLLARHRSGGAQVALQDGCQAFGCVGLASGCVRQQPRILPGQFRGHPPPLAAVRGAQVQLDHTARRSQFRQPRHGVLARPRGDLGCRQVAHLEQQHGQLIRSARRPRGPVRDLGHGLRPERQPPRARTRQQVIHQLATERQFLQLPLSLRRVPLVQIHAGERIQQTRGQRRRRSSLDCGHADAPLLDALQHLVEMLQVQHIAQAVAVRLRDDRKVGLIAHRGQQVARLEPLQPERGAPASA